MTLRVADFEYLRAANLCLSDASSIAAICDHAQTLTIPMSENAARALLQSPEDFDIEAPLAVLERWIVTEGIAVDMIALDSLFGKTIAHLLCRDQIEISRYSESGESAGVWRAVVAQAEAEINGPEPMLEARYPGSAAILESLKVTLTAVPPDVAEKCCDAVARTSHAIRGARPDVGWDEFGFGFDKSYGEELGDIYAGATFLARSNFGIERTIYYYELAAAAGIPVTLHPARGREAHLIAAASLDAYRAVQTTLAKSFDGPVSERLANFGLSWRGSMPPLSEALIREAGRRGCSILQMAHESRSSESASAFRLCLKKVQDALARATPESALEVARALKELESVTRSWVEQLDTKHSVTFRRRSLNLTWLPKIGMLLGLLPEMTLKDPILNPRGYLSFISSWYDPSSARGA